MSQNIFKNPFVSSPPVLSGASVGNGTLTIDRLTHFTITQDYSVICTAVAPFTVFKVIGSLDGSVGVAVVGTQFYDQDLKIFLTIQQGPNLFQIGDTFTLSVEQGIDLNRENIDLYDELPQKNFGVGTAGALSGDHNLKLNLTGLDSALTLGDLNFVSKLADMMEGNEISIEYLAGSSEANAQLIEQDLTFDVILAGLAGNNYTIEYRDFIQGLFSSVSIQDFGYISQVVGTVGDLISIEYTGGGTLGSEVVGVIGNAITVQIQDGVSTPNTIGLAIAAFPAAIALIGGGPSGTGLEPQNIQAATFLAGGVDPIGQATQEDVSIIGTDIVIYLESGVSTAQNVATAFNLEPTVNALITATVSGTVGNPQLAPIAVQSFTGGSDDLGLPGAEFVEVVGDKNIQVTFNDGLSTATQIKDAIDANVDAFALITTGITGTAGDFQASPIAKTYLKGGRPTYTYGFNINELTDPDTFFQGSGSIAVKDVIAHGRLLTIGNAKFNMNVEIDDNLQVNTDANIEGNLDVNGTGDIEGTLRVGGNATMESDLLVEGESTLNGRTELNDEVGANESGLVILNAQKEINNKTFTAYGVETIAGGGTISTSVTRGMQTRRVKSSGTALQASLTPFGIVGGWVDGTQLRIKGDSDADTLELQSNDNDYGLILNGRIILAKYIQLTLEWDAIALRWIEISRNS